MTGFALGMLTSLVVLSAGAEDDALWVTPGSQAAGSGLAVSSQPDGRFEAVERDGRACVETLARQGSPFLYVNVDDDYDPPETLFVTVDYFDQHGMITLHFDAGEGMSAYRPVQEAYQQQGSAAWKQATFTLRTPEFKNRENGGTDFRLHADGPLAVSRIALCPTPPEGFEPPVDPAAFFEGLGAVRAPQGMTVIQQWQIHEPVSKRELADPAYETAKRVGATSLQSYVGWAQLEPEQGKLDYSLYDPVVAQIEKHGLKWLPFLITAPLVATPEWWRANHGVDSVCLEHGTATPIQSIWNPDLRDGVRRFLEVFHEHYPPDVIEALNLGISGNWGESIVVAGGGFGMGGQHSHLGWWCGDAHARADFRRWAKARYTTLDQLNEAWRTNHANWDAVAPFIPAEAPSRRAAADLFQWYTESMTDYAEHWVRIARELYPDLPVYLCTGGNGQPELAADFAAQARMCAKYGAGIRITNQSDDAAANFAVTRMVSSSTRLYGGYYTTEPGGANTAKGMAGRIFDAVAGGARGVYFKTLVDPPDRPSATAVAFAGSIDYLVPNQPELTVAALMPNSSLAIDRGTIDTLVMRTQVLREALNYEFIDENMVRDGLLDRFRALLVLAGDTVERPVLDAIGAWVEKGGVLLAVADTAPLRDVDHRTASWWTAMPESRGDWTVARHGEGFVVVLKGEGTESRERLSQLLHGTGDTVPWEGPLSEPLDAAWDGLLATRAGDRVFYYNGTDAPVSKTLPGGIAIAVAPRSILAVP